LKNEDAHNKVYSRLPADSSAISTLTVYHASFVKCCVDENT